MTGASIRFPHLGIVIEHLDKSISIFGFNIAYYGIIIGIGMLCGIAMAVHEAKRTGQNPEMYYDFALCAIVSAIVGCRVYYVAFEWSYYSQHPLEILNLRQGGLAIYGGIIGGFICMVIFSKIRKASLLLMADTVAPALLIGQIIGRWGNFFNREAFGGYSDGLLAMQIRVDEAAYTTQDLMNKAVTIDGTQYIQVQPTFLYESLWNLGVLIIILLYRKHKKFDGELFMMYLFGYGIGRFIIESFRTDQLLLPYIGLPVSQVFSACLAVFALIVMIYKRSRLREEHTQELIEYNTIKKYCQVGSDPMILQCFFYAHSREDVDCRKRPRSARECAKAHSFI